MRVKSAFLNVFVVSIIFCLCAVAVADPPTWTISGVVATADGTGVEGVNIVPDGGITPTVTAADGFYSVVVPNHWDGTVAVNKIGWLIIPTSKSYTNVIENLTGQNYTAYQPKISGIVTKSDGTPLAGATVAANNGGGTDTTDVTGYYELNVPYNWSGTIAATLAGYHFTDKSYSNVIADQVNQDFSGYQPTISGSTTVAGAAITISGIGVITSKPDYMVTVPYGWSGTITAELAGYDFTNSPLSYTNVTTDLMNQNFTSFQPTISGSTGIAGATVTISGIGSIVSTPAYSVTVPYGWGGTVEASLVGYHFSESPRSYVNVTTDTENQDFTPFQPIISGIINQEDGAPVAGVTIVADNGGGSDTSDASGYYEIIIPYNWSGKVTASRLGWQIDPNLYEFTNVVSDILEQDFQAVNTGIHVVLDGSGDFTTIQAAINAAKNKDVVQVCDGIYTGSGNRDIDFLGKAITVRGNVVDPNLVVIDCQGTETNPHRGFKFVRGETSSSVLEGFTITNGYGPQEARYSSNSVGGAILCYYSSPTIQNCIMSENVAGFSGGGIQGYYNYSMPTIRQCLIIGNTTDIGGGIAGCGGIIENCIISSNSVHWSGGGLHGCGGTIRNSTIISNSSYHYGGGIAQNNGDANGTIIDCTISDNSARLDGGGLYNCDGTIENCIITENSANFDDGGGLWGCDGVIKNCIVCDNIAWDYGGGFFFCGGIIQNCTVSGNSADWAGGGFRDCNGTIEGCIIWGNTARDGIQIYASSMPSYSCIQNWTSGGTGNISETPLFVDMATGDYHLSFESPCINTGNPSFMADSDETDIDGNWRVVGGRIDMGSDEVGFEGSYIYLSTQEFNFTALEDGANPLPQSLNIRNFGYGDDLNWSIPTTSSWLKLSKTQGIIDHTTQETITALVDITGLSHGIYSCNLVVADPNAINSPQVVQVELEVIGPEISLNSNVFSFCGSKETLPIESQVLTVQNPSTAGGTLNWQIDIPAECQWLLAEPMSGQSVIESEEITLSIDPAYAEYGVNTCQFTVSDPNASNSPQVVTLTLDVLRPEIGVSPESILFECDVDDPNVLTQSLAIFNSGYDTLNWQISEDCDWLSISPTSGQCSTEVSEVTLTVDTAGLEIGFYDCELMITGGNASNSPVTVPVSLHVYRDGERHVPTEYPTIQEAIDAAVDGDHVVIHPGWYREICSIYKNITIRSIDPDDKEIVESTVLSGSANGGFYIECPVVISPVIDGLTFTRFMYTPIRINWCNPVIRNCVFRDNYMGWSGTLECYYSSALVENCEFIGNSAYSIIRLSEQNTSGAGGTHTTTFKNCLFAENILFIEPSGCVSIENTSAIFENCTIANNYSVGNGFAKAIPVFKCRDSRISVNNSIIYGNRGFYIDDEGILSVNEMHQVAVIDGDYSGISEFQISHSQIEGGQESILLFPYALYDRYYWDYVENGILPDPNLLDPNMLNWGDGNFDIDPLFAREPNDGGDGWFPMDRPGAMPDYTALANNIRGDYHLKSEAGRFVWDGFAKADFNLDKRVDLIDFSEIAQYWGSYTAYNYYFQSDLNRDAYVDIEDFILFCEDYLQSRVFGAWVTDDVTSPCIDAGDPNDPGWQGELWPHGGRVNMGAYGGTPQTSMSPNDIGNPGDLNHDNAVDLADWSLWADDWMAERVLLDSDFDRDNDVDPNDLDIFMNNWLWME